jgi:6-phosphogluconolactonase
VNVTGIATGLQNNVTSTVTSNQGGNGGTGAASIMISGSPTIGRYLYSTNTTGTGRVTSHAINAATGQLRFNGYAAVGNSGGVSNAVVLPNLAGTTFVYAADSIVNEIYGFSASANGQLTPLTLAAGFPVLVPQAANLGIVTVASTNNIFLYAFGNGGFAVQTVNYFTGVLSNLTASSTFPPTAQMVSDPAGKYAYFGTSSGVAAYTIDPNTGALQAIAGSPFPSGKTGSYYPVLATSPAGGFLYSINPGDNSIRAFSITSTGALQLVGTAGSTGIFPTGLAIDPLSQFVFVSNVGDGTISPFAINSDGSLTAEAVVTTGAQPGQLVVDPSDKFLYVSDQTGSSIHETGIQTFSVTINPHPPGTPPVATLTPVLALGEPTIGSLSIVAGTTAVSYAPQFAYVSDEGTNQVSAYLVDSATGNLTQTATSPYGAQGSQTIAVTTDLPGRFVYAANQSGNPATVAAFTITSSGVNAGSLTSVAGMPFSTGQVTASGVVVEPSSRFAYVTNAGSNSITEYGVSQTSGVLAPITGSPYNPGTGTISSPGGMAISPFGSTLFVTNSNIDTVAALAIGPSGTLSNFFNSPIATGAPGPQTPEAVVVDPSNRFMYVANTTAKNIAAYQFTDMDSVNPVSFGPISGGTFTFSTPPSLGQPTSLAIEPTGHFLYVTLTATGPAGSVFPSIVTYQINQTTGALTQVGSPLIEPLNSGLLQGAAADPSGKFFYVVSNNGAGPQVNSIILRFLIDPVLGTLSSEADFSVGYGPTSVALTATIQ